MAPYQETSSPSRRINVTIMNEQSKSQEHQLSFMRKYGFNIILETRKELNELIITDFCIYILSKCH